MTISDRGQMLNVAAARASSSSLLTYLLAGGLLFTFGYLRAVWVRARRDYKNTKAAVKPLRKAMWGAIFKALRYGAIVVIAGFALVVWVVHDVRTGDQDATVTPADVASHSPSPHPSRSHRK